MIFRYLIRLHKINDSLHIVFQATVYATEKKIHDNIVKITFLCSKKQLSHVKKCHKLKIEAKKMISRQIRKK